MLQAHISRRGFIKKLGLCSTGVALLSLPGVGLAAKPGLWQERIHDETRLMMGTIVRITVARSSSMQADTGMGKAFDEMERLIAIFDRHQGNTVISELNRSGRISDAPEEFVGIVRDSCKFGRLTDHAFDITVQPVLDLFEKHSNASGELHVSADELATALHLVNPNGISVNGSSVILAHEGMGITLDGIAKGYIVDQAAAILKREGLNNFLINAGGDIRCSGEKRPGVPWVVAVEDPDKRSAYPDVVAMNSGAIATSGVYERFFDKTREHNHLIMPQNGASPTQCLSVTVKAPTTMEADIMATALSVMQPDKAMRLIGQMPGYACLFVTKQGVVASSGWKA